MVQGKYLWFATMVDDFPARLKMALQISDKTWPELSAHLGASYQARKKYDAGTSKSMTAINTSKAARFMGVNTDWLATGTGQPRPVAFWPFTRLTPAEWESIGDAIRTEVEDRLVGAVDRLVRSRPIEEKPANDPASSPAARRANDK